ncbi:glucuronate isomerase [Bythopirellula polymerisocia]|uniref:Uronate isomerase n=1 Tax=Bythopirellula polymerisocia TaxID=2528003 RepID=A0A5C6CXV0_9BACT|nr:glucuronate isomerase [Bythopirellula polymerisocia]TWU27469.1 Uronate isomerase [Bythopirellula polymerisocia]
MSFIHDDFLLQTKTSRRLYHEFAASEPILDYHTHLPPAQIATNHRFADLAEMWLAGDHYKWRAMRANGVAEEFCTGGAEPYDKFLAWAKTVPHTLRNPLYHWTHMELKRYFDIDELLNEDTAPGIWRDANEQLHQGYELTVHGIFHKFQVRGVCTTDDPTDNLTYHRRIADSSLTTGVFPTYRPDRVLEIDQTKQFNTWVDKLAEVSDVHIVSFADLLSALQSRHQFFHEVGCRLSDHGLSHAYADFCDDHQAAAIFAKARTSGAVSPAEQSQFATNLMLHIGRWNYEMGWTMQLHLGALRNANAGLMEKVGRDVGGDSIGDWPQAETLSRFLGRLDSEHSLPKTIVYNLNPADNYMLATMIGNFQDGSVAGKIQMGSGWWFLDQWEAMQWQMNALSNQGLLSRFIGMLTDSRSFLSYPRHEYFRRCLCDLLGTDVERGAIPNDDSLLGPMIRNICYGNAREYLGLGV